MSEDIVKFMDFSSSPEPIRFKIDDDIFEAHRVLSITSMQGAVRVMKDLGGLKNLAEVGESEEETDDTLNKMAKFVDIFDELLKPESAQLFKKRALSKENPIGLQQIIKIIEWLLEVYGFRPTQQSSISSTGSANDDTGTASTDGAQPDESVPSS